MRDPWWVSVRSWGPGRALSRWLRTASSGRGSEAAAWLFAWAYDVDLAEAAPDDGTLSAVFTRPLRPDARPVDGRADVVVSPADGVVVWRGTTWRDVPMGTARVATLAQLLGRAPDGPRDVAVVYLSPRDYHRVHAPTDLTWRRWAHVAGARWPVMPAVAERVHDVLGRNERVRLEGDATWGAVTLVLVAAFGVGHVAVPWAPEAEAVGAGPLQAPPATRGDEVATFGLGSTVVLIAPAGRLDWEVPVGGTVRVGRALARVR